MPNQDSSQFAPSWYSAFESPAAQTRDHRLRAFVRLWRAFMRARVFIAVVIMALQSFVVATGEGTRELGKRLEEEGFVLDKVHMTLTRVLAVCGSSLSMDVSHPSILLCKSRCITLIRSIFVAVYIAL